VENLAYVIYMPGSTGEPRGVMVTSANLCDHMRAMQIPLEITADE
jgi:acyl-CoA synthetase (AMP-forming)/AMP-acid ligase II